MNFTVPVLYCEISISPSRGNYLFDDRNTDTGESVEGSEKGVDLVRTTGPLIKPCECEPRSESGAVCQLI